MKWINPEYLSREAEKSLKRFPFTIGASLVAVMATIIYIYLEKDSIYEYPLISLILTSMLGIPLFFCIKIFFEARGKHKNHLLAGRITGILLLVILYFSFPLEKSILNTDKPYIRYLIINICLHLMVAFLPFLRKSGLNAFWQYNRILFIRILTAALFSVVLYAGIAIAFTILDPLFEIDVEKEPYMTVAVLIFGLFNTWFFVSGIPEDFEKLESIDNFPRGLKIFALYILSPLVIVYFSILYGYVSKILVTGTWPEGIVSYMIIAVAIAGILNLLLIYPLKKNQNKYPVNKLFTGYFILLIPQIIVLFMAILMRISDYGVTVNRAIILILGFWLLLISIYFIFSSKKNIKLIPLSLCLIGLVFAFGPWSIFAVSERSQINRLENILIRNNLLKEGKILNQAHLQFDENGNFYSTEQKNSNNLPMGDWDEINSIVRYLAEFHSLEETDKWVDQDLNKLIESRDSQDVIISQYSGTRESYSRIYLKAFNIHSRDTDMTEKNKRFNFTLSSPHVYPVKDFHYSVDFDVNQDFYSPEKSISFLSFSTKSNDYNFKIWNNDGFFIGVFTNNDRIAELPLKPLLDNLENKYGEEGTNLPLNSMQLDFENDKIRLIFYFTNIYFENNTNSHSVNMRGTLLINELKDE